MSAEVPGAVDGAGAGSRLHCTKSVKPDFGQLSHSEQCEFLRESDDVLTIDQGTEPRVVQKVAEFARKYPERAQLPVSVDGSVREKYTKFVEESWEALDYSFGEFEGAEVSEYRPEAAFSWLDAVSLTLQRHASAAETDLFFEGEGGGSFTVSASNRWSDEYQVKQLAELHGWVRQCTGGAVESFDGDHSEEVEAEYDNPKLVLLTRSMSSNPEGGERLTPGEVESELSSSWSAVYDSLRNAMRSVGASDWSYDARGDPHGGGGFGVNACYGHEHVVVMADVEGSVGEVRREVRRAMEAHVRNTDGAGEAAHGLDLSADEWGDESVDVEACQVFDVSEGGDAVDNVAAYVGSYASLDADSGGLFERDVEFVAWAAAKDALNTRVQRRSEDARRMSEVDLELKRRLSGEGGEVDVLSDGEGGGGSACSCEACERREAGSDGEGGVLTGEWGGKGAARGSAVLHERAGERVRELAGERAGSVDVEALVDGMRSAGWDLRREVVEVAFYGERIESVVESVDEVSVPRVSGALGGDVSPVTVAAVLDGFELDPVLGGVVREWFEPGDAVGDVIDELRERDLEVTVEGAGGALGRDGFGVSVDQCESRGGDESSEWDLVAIEGPGGERREVMSGGGGVSVVDVVTARDAWGELLVVGPCWFDSASELVDGASNAVRWRYSDGMSCAVADGSYIRDELVDGDRDVSGGELWEFVQPHEAGEPDPFGDDSGGLIGVS